MIAKLKSNLLVRIGSVEFPTFDHIHNVIERLVGVRGRANDAVGVRSVTNDNPIDRILQYGAARADDGNQRDLITKALLDEILE